MTNFKSYFKDFLLEHKKLQEDINNLINPQTMVDPRNGKTHPQFTVNPKHEKSFKHKDSFKNVVRDGLMVDGLLQHSMMISKKF